MLTRIDRIEGLGVFGQYKKTAVLSDFARFNILYGPNGSGKTTLSRLFSYLGSGDAEAYPSLKYKFDATEGTFTQGQSYPCKIRVFNSDYVDSNIGEVEGQLNPIYVVGEENKSLVAQIQKDESECIKLEDEFRELEETKAKLERDRGKKFTEVAKLIASDTSGQLTRNYRKPDAEKAFTAMASEQIISQDKMDVHRITLRQTSLEPLSAFVLDAIPVTEIDKQEDVSLLPAIHQIGKKTGDICTRTSDSLAIQRLREIPDIASWVEQGLVLHGKHKSTECEYCQQPIPESRLQILGKHFNQSDRLLKEAIEAIIAEVDTAVGSLKSAKYPAKSELYEELREEYQTEIGTLEAAKGALDKHLNLIRNCLRDKLLTRTEVIRYEISDYDASEFNAAVTSVNALLERHSEKTREFEEHEKSARNAIELHHLNLIKGSVSEFDKKIKEADDRLTIILNGDVKTDEIGTIALKERINENREQVSNTAKAAANLTDLLQTFLGRNDLTFVPESDGYRIMRGEIAAEKLSEGERTAITFIYFIVQLGDQDFDLKDGIVVIDDPVSSLDSNSVYQAFSFLKNAVKDAKQIFLFTHNFDFLKLLLNWVKHIPKPEGKKSYYMLLCNLDQFGKREALVQPLDKELFQNENEYAYLFKQLYNFQSDGTIAGSYHIPNIARKVLETFLDFYYPGGLSIHRKLEAVSFDPVKKTALLKFANDLSHSTGKGFDPALVPETQKSVRYLLEMIEGVSPIHYSSLENSIGTETASS